MGGKLGVAYLLSHTYTLGSVAVSEEFPVRRAVAPQVVGGTRRVKSVAPCRARPDKCGETPEEGMENS